MIPGQIAVTAKNAAVIGGIDSFTKLMLHFDGANASTTFTDSSLSPHTMAANGNAQLSTSGPKYGAAAGLFDGSGDYVDSADSADWQLSGDFTIDCWAKPASLAARAVLVIQYNSNPSYMSLLIDTAGALRFWVTGIVSEFVSSNGAVVTGSWQHIALVRNSNTFTFYVNGTSVGTTSNAVSYPDISASLQIGGWPGNGEYLNGSLDELRISKGVARWTANFTPPAGPYS